MQKAGKIILIISLLANIILGYIVYNKPKERDFDPSVYISKIDSLELEISFLNLSRSSLEDRIDTVFVELKVNNDKYKETYNTIINNTVNDDYIFFSEYIERYSIDNF